MTNTNLAPESAAVPTSKHHRNQSLIRGIIGGALALTLLGSLAVGPIFSLSQTTSSFSPSFSISPIASDSSTWYCSVPSLTSLPGVSVGIKLANGSKFKQTASVAISSSVGLRTLQKRILSPGVIDTIALPSSSSGAVGVSIEFSGGGDFAAYEITGQSTNSQGFCQPSPGPTWTLQAISTLGSSDGVISLFNPFPSDSIVDINLISTDGISSPAPLQALVLAGRQSISIDIANWLQNQSSIGVSIQTRVGRVVPGGIELRSDSKATGVAPVVISPEIFNAYTFPLLGQSINQSVNLDLYNYSTNEVKVTVQLQELNVVSTTSTTEETKSDDATSSFVEQVPAQSSLSIPLKSITSIPVGTFFSLTVRDSGLVLPVVTLSGSDSGPTTGYFPEAGNGTSWPSWLSVLFANPVQSMLGKIAVVYESRSNGSPGLFVRNFYNGTRPLVGADGIDGQAGLALSGSKTSVNVFGTSNPGGFPSAFALRSSTYAVLGVAYVMPDGSLIPVHSIATD